MMNVRNKSRKVSFQPDLISMMESLGFDGVPLETLDTLEDILINYVVDIYNEALRSSELHGRTKIKFDDIKFGVRKDVEKLHRMDEISKSIRIINQNKKAFDSKGKSVKDMKLLEGLVSDEDGKPRTLTASGRPRKKYKKRAKKVKEEAANGEPRKKRKYTKRAARFYKNGVPPPGAPGAPPAPAS